MASDQRLVNDFTNAAANGQTTRPRIRPVQSMAYTIGCQSCRKRFRVHPAAFGRTLPCPICHLPIQISDPRLFGTRWRSAVADLPIAEPIGDAVDSADLPVATPVHIGGELKPPPLPVRAKPATMESLDSGLLELLDSNALDGVLLLSPRMGRLGRSLDWLEWTVRHELDFFPEGQGVVRFVASNRLACLVGAVGISLGMFEFVHRSLWLGPAIAALGVYLAHRGSRWEWAILRPLRLALWTFLIAAIGWVGHQYGEWDHWRQIAAKMSDRVLTRSPDADMPFPYRSIDVAEPTGNEIHLDAPPGIRAFEVRFMPVESRSGSPRREPGRLWVYVPINAPADHRLPCILVPASGPQLGFGAELSTVHRAEHLDFALAGFVVVAFDVAGAPPDKATATSQEMAAAFLEFKDSLAGLANARDAIEYAGSQLPQVDSERIMVAGHGAAGLLALLLAEHEPRIKACMVFASPTKIRDVDLVDAGPRLGQVADLADFLSDASPENHLALIKSPVFIFHSLDDPIVPAKTSDALRQALLRAKQQPRLVTIPQGGHFEATTSRGIYEAIVWLRSLNLAPSTNAESQPSRGEALG